MQIEVNGTAVVVRTKVPARDGYKLMPIMEKFQGEFTFAKLPYEDLVTIITTLVESWGFPGQPSDPEAVGNLDLRDMISVASEAAGAYWTAEETAPSPN